MLRRAARASGLALLALLALAGVVLATAQLALQTSWGREQLRLQVNRAVSRALDARFEIAHLDAASLWLVRGSGLRLVHGRERIASLERFSIRFNLLALVAGRLEVTSARLERPYVDLGAPFDAERNPSGLLGLLGSDDETEQAPTAGSGGMAVALHGVQVEGGHVELRRSGERIELLDIATRASVDLDAAPSARVDRLVLGVRRADKAVATVHASRLRYTASGGCSGQLRLETSTARLAADLALGAPGRLGARRVNARVSASRISPETLAELGIASDWLRSPIDLAAVGSGTTRDGDLDVRLSTRGGDVHLQARLSRGELITAQLITARLETRRVLRAGIDPIAATLEIRAKTAGDFSAVETELDLHDARYADLELPRAELRGRWSRVDGFSLDRLLARYARAGELRAHGRLRPDGALEAGASAHVVALERVPPLRRLAPGLSGSVDLRVSVSRARDGPLHTMLELTASQPALGIAGARKLRLDARSTGDRLATMQLDATLQAQQLRVARIQLERSRIDLHADARCYIARGDFDAQGELYLQADRAGEALSAVGTANVDLGYGQRLRLDLGRARYERGTLVLGDLRVAVGQADAKVSGWLQPAGEVQLGVAVRVPALRPLTQLALEQPVDGQLEVDARVEGVLRRPRAMLTARYRSPVLLGLRDADVTLDARANLPERRVELDLEAGARHAALEASVRSVLSSAELSLDALERSTHEISLEIERLPLGELQGFPATRMNLVAADLSGRVRIRGALSAPEANAKLETRARFRGDRNPVTLAVAADYAHAQLALDVAVEDHEGSLLRAHVRTDLDAITPPERSVASLSRLLTQRAWETEVSLRARRIDELPAVHAMSLPPALLPWRLSAHARFDHRPGEEPRGSMQMDASFQPAREQERVPRCGASGAPRLALEADMRDATLSTHTHVRFASEDKVSIETHSRAPIDQWLAPASPQPVDVVANFDRLRFASLPWVCEQLDGEMSGSVKLARAISRQVTLSAKLKATRMAWNRGPAFDAWLEARADREDVVAKLDMNGAGGAATLSAKIPLDPDASFPAPRTDAPARIEARLQAMSVPALLGGVPKVSADSGRLDGVIALRGSLAQPYFDGSLAFQNVSVTLGQIGQRFEDVTGKLTLNGRTLRFARTHVHDRDGQLEVSGELSLQTLDRMRAVLDAKAKRYPVRRDGIVLGRFDGRLHLVAEIDPQRTVLDLALRQAAMELTQDDLGSVQSLQPNRDVHFTDHRADDSPAASADARETVFRIDASEPLWVRREDFAVLISTRSTILSRKDAPPEITGVLEIRRGTIQLIGQMFDIDRGRIEFSGGHAVEPTLDLVARRKLPAGNTVSVEAQGPLHQPTLTFTVDDKPVSAEEALAVLSGAGATGSSSMEAQISSVATGMAAGVLTMGARRQLGEWVPVLAVESGAREERVRAGVEARRLIPKFLRSVVVDAYVEGIVTSAQNSNGTDSEAHANAQTRAGVLLELRFPHHLVGESQYGPGQRWSADFSWEP